MSSEGAKVTGYIRRAVYSRLVEFKEAHQLRSLSLAVTLVLEDYFGLGRLAEVDQSLPDRVSHLEQQLEELQAIVASIHQTMAQSLAEPSLQPMFSPKTGEGITQAELAQRLRVRESTISRNKKKPNFAQWSQAKDPEFRSWRYSAQSNLFFLK